MKKERDKDKEIESGWNSVGFVDIFDSNRNTIFD